MDGVGHWLMLEKPAEFNATLIDMLKLDLIVGSGGILSHAPRRVRGNAQSGFVLGRVDTANHARLEPADQLGPQVGQFVRGSVGGENDLPPVAAQCVDRVEQLQLGVAFAREELEVVDQQQDQAAILLAERRQPAAAQDEPERERDDHRERKPGAVSSDESESLRLAHRLAAGQLSIPRRVSQVEKAPGIDGSWRRNSKPAPALREVGPPRATDGS